MRMDCVWGDGEGGGANTSCNVYMTRHKWLHSYTECNLLESVWPLPHEAHCCWSMCLLPAAPQSIPVHGWFDAPSPTNLGLRLLKRPFASDDVRSTSRRLQTLPHRPQKMTPLRFMTCCPISHFHAFLKGQTAGESDIELVQSKLLGMKEHRCSRHLLI